MQAGPNLYQYKHCWHGEMPPIFRLLFTHWVSKSRPYKSYDILLVIALLSSSYMRGASINLSLGWILMAGSRKADPRISQFPNSCWVYLQGIKALWTKESICKERESKLEGGIPKHFPKGSVWPEVLTVSKMLAKKSLMSSIVLNH